MKVTVIPVIVGTLGMVPKCLVLRPYRPQHCRDQLEYFEESPHYTRDQLKQTNKKEGNLDLGRGETLKPMIFLLNYLISANLVSL